MYSINIPPIMVMNRMYENQNLLYTSIVPLMRHTIVICVNNILLFCYLFYDFTDFCYMFRLFTAIFRLNLKGVYIFI